MWIAASALQHGLDLFSYDDHFRMVKGLRVGFSLIHFSD
jgi:predicted nucleic acid-binding protein